MSHTAAKPETAAAMPHWRLLWQKYGLAAVLIIVHTVGVAGMAIPALRPWFQMLTPLNLLLTLGLMLYAGRQLLTTRHWWGLAAVYLFGYLVEVVGVNTGLIFGSYEYGTVLGIKVLETPLLIGVNWVILTYATLVVVQRIKSTMLASLLGAAIMTGLDYLIEPVAVKLEFWFWAGGQIPFQNFVGWFVTSFVFLMLNRQAAAQWANPLGILILVVQAAFFLCLQFMA